MSRARFFACKGGRGSPLLRIFSFVLLSLLLDSRLATAATEPTPGVWNNVTPAGLDPTIDYGTQSVQVDPRRPSDLYTQFNSQGVFKSSDYGVTWKKVSTGTNGTAMNSAGTIVIADGGAGNPPLLYAGNLRNSMGFWRSLDGGVSWTNYNIAPLASGRQDVYAPVVDPYDPQHLLMCGHEQDVLLQSTNGGQTWTQIPMATGMASNGGTSFLFFVNSGSAATTRNTWLFISQQDTGTWRTSNGGTTWTKVDTNTHPHGASQIYQSSPGGPIYLPGVYSTLGWGLLRSTNLGQTWTHVGYTTGASIAFGTPNNVYAAWGWAMGNSPGAIDPALEQAPQPGGTGWVAKLTPTGMHNGGAAQAAVTFDGTNYIIVMAAWNSGLWRYVEPAGTGAGSGTGSGPGSGTTPTVNLSASATNIAKGTNSMLSWSSTNASTCAASGGWSGAQATSGSKAVAPTATTTYTMTCSGTAGASTPASTTVAVVTIPTVPASVAATAGNAQVTLTWTANSSATSYNVKRATNSGGPYTTLASPTSATYFDSSAVNGTAYYYVVSAVNAGGESANSTQVAATPVAPAGGGTSGSGGSGSIPGAWSNVTPAHIDLVNGLSCGNYGTESVQADPSHPTDAYTLFYCQGLYKSSDYGRTWTGPINTGINGMLVTDCAGLVKVVPTSKTTPPTLYIACIRGTATGLWKSTSGGVAWTRLNVPAAPAGSGQQFRAPVVDPNDPQHLLITGQGSNLLVESKDGGATWAAVKTNSGMTMSGGTAGVQFINTGNAATTRTTWLWTASQGGGAIGTWRTADAGATWNRVDNNEHIIGETQIYQPDTSGVIFMAGVYSKLGAGVLKSTDFGKTWTHQGATQNEGIVFGTSKAVYSMYGFPAASGQTVAPLLQTAAPSATAWSAGATPAAMIQGPAQAAVLNDGTSNIILTANYHAGLWRYTETGGSSSGGTTPVPTATIAASATSITAGGNSTLTWSSTNATACTAAGGWTGAKAVSGSTVVSPATTTTYSLSCSGAGGTSSAVSATVTVTAVTTPAPTASLSASPASISSGGSLTLTWASTNATACTASGGWTGSKAVSGSATVSPTSTTAYALSCTGVNGSAQASATVSVSSSGSGGGGTLNFTAAPTMSGVTVIPNRDSVIIQVPAVANARDFRVLVQPTSVTANSNGTESVGGGTQFCAGARQHQARTRFVADNVTQFPYYFYINAGVDSPTNQTPQFYGTPPGAWSFHNLDTPPNLQIEVTGVTSSMSVTVEAMDRMCPFPGTVGRYHTDITLSHTVGDNNNPGNPWIDASALTSFPVVTEAEVIARYGSLIVNGQGWAGGPNVQATPPSRPPFAQPAPVNPPKVLARATVTIAPLANPPAAPSTFFDDFSNANDTFAAIPIPNWTYPRDGAGEKVLQNSKWTVFANGYTCCSPTAADDGYGYADAYVENGQMKTVLSDWSQGVLSEVSMFPRKAAHLNSSSYLHVTYEVPSFATSRRYWVVSLCGSGTAGQTLDANGVLKEQVVHTTFFYTNTGANPSTAGWNCLQVFNREGNSYAFSNWESMYNIHGGRPPVPPNKGLYDLADYVYNAIPSIADPTKIAAYTVHPESDVVVLVNKPIPKAGLPEKLGTNEQVVQGRYTSPVNVSPMQLDNPAGEVAWFYRVDANGNPVAGILDDQQLVAPRTKYDLYIRNNRLIMYVNGQARLCNDFTTPTTTLNIADAAVGFHQVLYHSSGEFKERFVDPDRGAAYHYRYNSPWIDSRTWDNIGFQENVAAPADFDPNTCFVHTSRGAENNEP